MSIVLRSAMSRGGNRWWNYEIMKFPFRASANIGESSDFFFFFFLASLFCIILNCDVFFEMYWPTGSEEGLKLSDEQWAMIQRLVFLKYWVIFSFVYLCWGTFTFSNHPYLHKYINTPLQREYKKSIKRPVNCISYS